MSQAENMHFIRILQKFIGNCIITGVNKMQELSNYWDAISYVIIKYNKLKQDGMQTPYVGHPIRITSLLRAMKS